MNGIWVILIIVVMFALFVVGCVIAQSQAEAEIDDIVAPVRFSVTVRTKGFGNRKWYESTTYASSIESAQEILNSYNWSSVLFAHAYDNKTNERWVAAENGIFQRVRGVTIDV